MSLYEEIIKKEKTVIRVNEDYFNLKPYAEKIHKENMETKTKPSVKDFAFKLIIHYLKLKRQDTMPLNQYQINHAYDMAESISKIVHDYKKPSDILWFIIMKIEYDNDSLKMDFNKFMSVISHEAKKKTFELRIHLTKEDIINKYGIPYEIRNIREHLSDIMWKVVIETYEELDNRACFD